MLIYDKAAKDTILAANAYFIVFSIVISGTEEIKRFVELQNVVKME